MGTSTIESRVHLLRAASDGTFPQVFRVTSPPAALPEGPLIMGVPYVILVTKYHRLSGLGDKIYFLAVPEVGKSKITVLASSAPGEGSRPGPQATASPCVLTWRGE